MRDEDSGVGGQGTHVIRLRGPWRSCDGERVSLPCDWRDAFGETDEVTLRRSFNWVRDLGEVADVRLRLASRQAIKRVALNDSPAADGDDVRPVLAGSNQLTVELVLQDPQASVLDAWLEITERAP